MKLGEIADPINSKSFKISLGWGGPENAEGEKRILHTFIDKSVELVDFGSRDRISATFTIDDINKTDYLELVEYLDLKQGQAVKFTQENDTENIFTESNPLSEYYIVITGFDNIGEIDFSTTRDRFTVSLTAFFIGETASSRPVDTSKIDILVKIDTLQFDYTSTPVTANVGEKLLLDGVLYKYDGTDWVFVMNAPPNDSALSFENGSFYFSLFSDISNKTTTPDIMDGSYMSGMISRKSMRLQNNSIRISDGPNIAYKNGFSFKLANHDKFWNFIVANGIPLFGAKVTVWLYNETGGEYYLQKLSTGKNNKNSFGYTEYEFECEPIFLNSTPRFNNSLIEPSNPRYSEISAKNSEKPPFRTYGRWEYAKLQDISTIETRESISVKRFGHSDYSDLLNFSAYIDRTIITNFKYKTLYVYKTGTTRDLVLFTSDQIAGINGNSNYVISINYDSNTGSGNKDKIIKIESIVDNTTHYTLTLSTDLVPGVADGVTAPATSTFISCAIYKSNYRFQIDEGVCGGFKIFKENAGPLVLNPQTGLYENEDVYFEGIKVYGLNDEKTDVEEIPHSKITSNVDNNILSLDPEIVTNKTKVEVFEDVTIPTQFAPPRVSGSSSANFLQYVSKSTNSFSPLFSGSYSLSSRVYYNPSVSGVPYSSGDRIPINNTVAVPSQAVRALEISIDHTLDDPDFLALKSVKLGLNIRLETYRKFYDILTRRLPMGLQLFLRLRKFDGSYLYGDSIGADWSHSIDYRKMSVNALEDNNIITAGKEKGVIDINNIPGLGEFGDITELDNVIEHFVIYFHTSRASRFTTTSNVRHGDKVLVLDGGELFVDEATVSGTTVSYIDGALALAPGTKFFLRGTNIKKVSAGGNSFGSAIPGTDYVLIPKFGGKNLFDLSPLFGDNPTWGDYEAIELIVTNDDFNGEYSYEPASSVMKNDILECGISLSLNSKFSLYGVTEKELINRPLYTSCDGLKINDDGVEGVATYPMGLRPIFKNILKEVYNNNLDLGSIDELALVRNIKLRKQFYSTMTAEEVLNEILLASWSCAFFDKNDNLKIKSLNEADYPTPSISFNDSNIIGVGSVKMRDADEIYQKYKIKYNFHPPGMDSNLIKKYKNELYVDQFSGNLDSDSRLSLQRSSNLFLNENAYEKEIEYIYREEDAKKLMKYIINWFVYNSWEIDIEVSLSSLLNGQSLNVMDYVKFNSNFYTNNLDIYGFITEVRPNIYEGTLGLSIYIPRPKGQLGPYLDPFNDALFLKIRDISSWTDENGKRNDSGRVSTRTILDYTQKEAGWIRQRNFND